MVRHCNSEVLDCFSHSSSADECVEFERRATVSARPSKVLILYENTCTRPKTLVNATENEESGRERDIRTLDTDFGHCCGFRTLQAGAGMSSQLVIRESRWPLQFRSQPNQVAVNTRELYDERCAKRCTVAATHSAK